MQRNTVDVAIMGGGLAGLTLAIQLQQTLEDVSVLVLEKNKHPVPEAAHKVGESTVEIGAQYFARTLGLVEHMQKAQLPKLGLRFFFPSDTGHDIQNRLEVGVRRFHPTPTYQIDRGRFENYLGEVCRERDIKFLDDTRVSSFEVGAGDTPHLVRFINSEGEHEVEARWLIDATSRTSLLKRKLNLAEEAPHNINAAWFRYSEKINIDEWSDDPEYRAGHEGNYSRWFSTNHLMGEGYWVWVIPLGSGSTSVGIVADPRVHPLNEYNSLEKAMQWLRKNEPLCAQKLEGKEGLVQDFLALKHYSRKNKQQFSEDRWAMTGDAGVFIDPFYSPGSDYIAIANTLICNLIRKDKLGEEIGQHARIYDELYRGFSDNTFALFEDQYLLYGSSKVMSTKILWDFATYWSFLAFVVLQERLCDLRTFLSVRGDLEKVSRLNRDMQEFFRSWAKIETRPCSRGRVDITRIEFLYNLNSGLLDELNTQQFLERLGTNVERLGKFSSEIVDRVGRTHEFAKEHYLAKESPIEGFLEGFFPQIGM